jgi:hypothetical protein
LLDKCGLVIAAGFSVGLDQTEHRILDYWSERSLHEARHGLGPLSDCAGGKTADADDAGAGRGG